MLFFIVGRAVSSDKRSYLSVVDLFQDLEPEVMAHLEHVVGYEIYNPGAVIYDPTQTNHLMVILKQGQAAISRRSPDGQKVIIATLGPGAVFCEMAMADQGLRGSYAEALTECLVCRLDWADMQQLIISDSRVAVRLIRALGARLSRAEAYVEELVFKAVPARLASLLLRLGTETDWRGQLIVSGLTHQQLAEMIGASRETVTVTLNRFRVAGLVETSPRRIVLLNPEGLVRMIES